MNLILYGFKRVGKTTYGKKLAHALQCPFVDTDDLIIEAYQKEGHPKLPIHIIHQELKEEAFRKLEAQVVQQLHCSDGVIAVGGGTILSSICYQALKNKGTLIYLKKDKEAVKRALLKGRLPSYLDPENVDSSFEEMYQKRAPVYERLADVTLDLTLLNESQIISKLKECALF